MLDEMKAQDATVQQLLGRLFAMKKFHFTQRVGGSEDLVIHNI